MSQFALQPAASASYGRLRLQRSSAAAEGRCTVAAVLPRTPGCAVTRINGTWNKSRLHRLSVLVPCAPHPRAAGRCMAGVTAAAVPPSGESASEAGVHDVVELAGMRANLEGQEPVVEYRVRWADGSPDTWELASDLSPDLVRDFDERWWQAAKKADTDTLLSMLRYSAQLLPQVVDENRRSALHFAAAVGGVKAVRLLVDAGAEVDLQDTEGYTPLHMAAGYMQTGAMTALLEVGADPLLRDKAGRDVVSLVERLRGSMPPSMGALQRIMALEQVAAALQDRLYEEVEPQCILDERPPSTEGGQMEFLVQFQDGIPDEWLPETSIAQDLLDDWRNGLERAPVSALLDVQQWGTSREYLVQWADNRQASWEPEELIPMELVDELQQQQPGLFRGLKSNSASAKRRRKRSKRQRSAAVGSSEDDSNGGGNSSSSQTGVADGTTSSYPSVHTESDAAASVVAEEHPSNEGTGMTPTAALTSVVIAAGSERQRAPAAAL